MLKIEDIKVGAWIKCHSRIYGFKKGKTYQLRQNINIPVGTGNECVAIDDAGSCWQFYYTGGWHMYFDLDKPKMSYKIWEQTYVKV